MLPPDFFDRDARTVAQALLGKVLRRRYGDLWLSAAIVETEAYYRREKGSHASLGRTPSREALFMPAGTIYMYYARGGDSLNVSCRGPGNAVLFKAGRPFLDERSGAEARAAMHRL
ncbi:MAG: DNA-3-methyladenine glycosylase, partial [Deltaproteobacteria bacterium]